MMDATQAMPAPAAPGKQPWATRNESIRLMEVVGGSLQAMSTVGEKLQQYPAHGDKLREFLTEFMEEEVEVDAEEEPPTATKKRGRKKKATPNVSSSQQSAAAPPPKPHGRKKYLNRLQAISNGESRSLDVELDDVIMYFGVGDDDDNASKGTSLVAGLLTNSRRYLQLLYVAADKVKHEFCPTPDTAADANARYASMEQANVSVHLRVNYEIHLVPPKSMQPLPVRAVRACHVGGLVRMEAVVSKITSVKPRMQVAYYKCYDCGADAYQPVDGPNFMPQWECNSGACVKNRRRGDLQLRLRECKFLKYQEIRVQEPPYQVPQGSVPRSMRVIAEGELTRKLSPGMSVTLGGVLLPVVKTGYAAMRSGLVADTYFEVHSIDVHKRGYGEEMEMSIAEADEKLKSFEKDPALYEKMSNSIAPSIHGHEDVKKVLLLQLVGGVSEDFPDGLKVRGDIHVLLMGDPGVAKSQLLGRVCKIAPRAHYTTGKGSSGVGLTASVAKDPTTGEFTLEGGAIVLSDNGVCAIDEFDKMDESDRTAIHEVMEQQTVSIAKAGITTSLNARTSILAAANPVYGRYDIRKSPVANMNLPAALLSRFDIQFLLLDRADRETDTKLAKHVLYVHQTGRAPPAENSRDEPFDARNMRLFIARARTFNPKIPHELSQEIVEHYVNVRARERLETDQNEMKSYTTPRTLFAMLRLSQALARLRRVSVVDRHDFEEALRLVQASKRSVYISEEEQQASRRTDFRSDIMEVLKDMDERFSGRRNWKGWLHMNDVENQVTRMGFNRNQLMNTLEEYVELGVLLWKDNNQSQIAFVERAEQNGLGADDDDDEEEEEERGAGELSD